MCLRQNYPKSPTLEKGLTVRTLRQVLEDGDAALPTQFFASDNADPMVALNAAMMTDGLVIEIADGAALAQPLHIVHIASGLQPAAMFTRSLLKLGKNASATLVESYIAGAGSTAIRSTTLWPFRSVTGRGLTMSV